MLARIGLSLGVFLGATFFSSAKVGAIPLNSILTRPANVSVQRDTEEEFIAAINLQFGVPRIGVGACVNNCTFTQSFSLFDPGSLNWSATLTLRNEFTAFGDSLYVDELIVNHINAPHDEPQFTVDLGSFFILNPLGPAITMTNFSALHPPATHDRNRYEVLGSHVSFVMPFGGQFTQANVRVTAIHPPQIPVPASGFLLLGSLLGLRLLRRKSSLV